MPASLPNLAATPAASSAGHVAISPSYAPMKAALARHVPQTLLAELAQDLNNKFYLAGAPAAEGGAGPALRRHDELAEPPAHLAATPVTAVAAPLAVAAADALGALYPGMPALDSRGVGLQSGGGVDTAVAEAGVRVLGLAYPDLRPTARTLQIQFDLAAMPAITNGGVHLGAQDGGGELEAMRWGAGLHDSGGRAAYASGHDRCGASSPLGTRQLPVQQPGNGRSGGGSSSSPAAMLSQVDRLKLHLAQLSR